MSERYSYLYTLPQNLYTVGSPVLISAGTLLKDNQNGRIIAQLKFRSISNKIIKAVKVKLNLFDTAGNPIGESVVYDYLDLSVSRNVEFGQKTPVPVSDNIARSYSVAVTEVVFGDRSVWTEADGKWEPLSNPQWLMLDDELLKQYRIKYGIESKYVAKEEKDLWHCTCGTLNHKGEPCCTCYNTLLDLQTLDMARLEGDKNVRLMEEARQVAAESERLAIENQQKECKKKKYVKLGIIAAVVLIMVAVAIGVVTSSPQYIAKQTIREGFTHYKNKDFYKARDIWRTVGQETSDKSDQTKTGYTPSNEELLKYGEPLLYEYAYYMSCQYGFSEAIPLYELIPDYKDSEAIASEMKLLLEKYIGEYKCVSRIHTAIVNGGKREPESKELRKNIYIDNLRYCESTPVGICMNDASCQTSLYEPLMLSDDGSLECSFKYSPYTYKYTISADASIFTEVESFHSDSGVILVYETIWKKIV